MRSSKMPNGVSFAQLSTPHPNIFGVPPQVVGRMRSAVRIWARNCRHCDRDHKGFHFRGCIARFGFRIFSLRLGGSCVCRDRRRHLFFPAAVAILMAIMISGVSLVCGVAFSRRAFHHCGLYSAVFPYHSIRSHSHQGNPPTLIPLAWWARRHGASATKHLQELHQNVTGYSDC